MKSTRIIALGSIALGASIALGVGCSTGSSGGADAGAEGGIDLFAKRLSLHIKVVDREGRPVFGAAARVNGAALPGSSAADGMLHVQAAPPAAAFGLNVSAAGYVNNVQVVDTGGAEEVNVLAPLLRVGTTVRVDPAAGATITEPDAGTVVIPPNSFSADGGVVTTPVDVSVTTVSQTDVAGTGTFGVNGQPDQALRSLGAIAVSATSNGAPVDLGPGKTFTISLPATIPPSTDGGVPLPDAGVSTPVTSLPAGVSPPPVWKQNPITGNWDATNRTFALQNGQWVAQVDSIATWNCDYPDRVTCTRGTITTPNGSPLGAAVVSGRMTGLAAGFLPATTVLNATTGSGGSFCMEAVPSSQLMLMIACPQGATANLGPFTVNVPAGPRCANGGGGCGDLGTIRACCVVDADCASGEVCKDGICKTPVDGGNVGDPCGTTADCVPGSVCFNQFCVGSGALRVSLSWSVTSDFDLHLKLPNAEEISFERKSASGGTLDVDQCVSDCPGTNHVENIVFNGALLPGTYTVTVVNYNGLSAGAFAIEVAGKVTASFSGSLPNSTRASSPPFTFTVAP